MDRSKHRVMDIARQQALAAFASRVERYVAVGQWKRALQGAAGSLLAVTAGRHPPVIEPTDVLVLHSSAYVSPGKRRLIDCLTRRPGLSVQEYVLGGWRAMATRGHLMAPSYHVLGRFVLKASMARYLVERYRPKVLVISTEDTIAPFLRFEVNRLGGRLINIAHSIVFPSPLYAMCDYDYYFIYGRTSLESLQRNQDRFGSARVLLTGSADLGLHEELTWSDASVRRLTYFSTWLPRNQRTIFLTQFAEIEQFAERHSDWEVVVRLHPLEDSAYWTKVAARRTNIKIVAASEPIAESVRGACLTLCPSHSTTALDSACLGRPPIILDCDEAGARFFDRFPELKRQPGEPLALAIERVTRDNSRYRRLMGGFLADNLAHRSGVAELMSDHIAAICSGNEGPGFIPL